MAKYPRLFAELAATPWAITAEALDGLLAAVRGETGALEYSDFHGAASEEHRALASMLGPAAPDTRLTRIKGDVGSLTINGPIVPHASLFTEASGLVSIERLTAEFQALEQNPAISTVLLVFDSPGGAVTGVSEFANLVRSSEKRTLSYVYGYAASAAYWMASAADEIIASNTGLVGSIGVIVSVRKNGAKEVEVLRNSQSPKKALDPSTDAGKDETIKILDSLASVFVDTVASNRKTDPENVLKNFGQGAVFGAEVAQKNGMIDQIAYLQDFLNSLESNDSYANSVPSTLDMANKETYVVQHMCNQPHEESIMTFDELLAQHKVEIDSLKAEAHKAGAEAERERFAAMLAKVKPVLESDTYPKSLKETAFAVLAGEERADVLKGALLAIDAMKAESEAKAAVEDSAEMAATPTASPDADKLSTDGILRSVADANADVAKLKEYI